jgi:hypothetical protein
MPPSHCSHHRTASAGQLLVNRRARLCRWSGAGDAAGEASGPPAGRVVHSSVEFVGSGHAAPGRGAVIIGREGVSEEGSGCHARAVYGG